MKKWMLTLTALCLALTVVGCGQKDTGTEQPPLQEVTYSNLADEETRNQAKEMMAGAGITPEQIQVFFDHVEQFNSTVRPDELTDGFETRGILETKYDPWQMQEEWTTAYPDFLGYNCRITSYGLLYNMITVPVSGERPNEDMVFDLDSLEQDDSSFPGRVDAFGSLFAYVPTEATKNIQVHLKNLQKDWAERGIVFADNPKARMISVVLHTNLDGDELFIGHAGVLFPTEDGLYFLEKLSFQEPYQWVKFRNRTELSDYLMIKYDLDENQPTAPPFILENDQLMDGFRPRPAV